MNRRIRPDYSNEKYVTDDLDFVSYKPLKAITPIMEQLGFKMTGNTAHHPQTKLYVQFCAPPLTVGREPIELIELKTKHGTIETLSADGLRARSVDAVLSLERRA